VSNSSLRPSTQLTPAAPVLMVFCRLIANHHDLAIFERAPESGALLRRHYSFPTLHTTPLSDSRHGAADRTLGPLPSPLTGLPRLPEPLPTCRALPADRRCACSDCFPTHTAFPIWQRSASALSLSRPCSGFTHFTPTGSRPPPKATFVTRLQPCPVPAEPLVPPDQSTTPGWNLLH